VIAFGAAITVTQGLQKGWCKHAAIAMGACTTIISAINTKVFPTDRRELRAAVVEGNRLVTKMHRRAPALHDALTPQIKAALSLDLEEVFGKFDGLAIRVSGGEAISGEPNKTSWFGTTVYAITTDNSCGLTVKSDALRLYYLETYKNSSVDVAKETSRANAITGAAKDLTPTGLDQSVVQNMLAKLTVVDDTSYTYDSGSGQYTYCTSIRINKTALNLLRTAPVAKDTTSNDTARQVYFIEHPIAMTYLSAIGFLVQTRSGRIYSLKPASAQMERE
jgi:hypothetical protein